MRPRIAALSLLAVFATLANAASPASAANPDKKAIWGPLTRNGKSEFPVYQRLGVGIYEMDLDWATTAPTRPRDPSNPQDPAYEWPADISTALHQAARYHMQVLLQASGTPSWANGGKAPTYPPVRMGDLGNFLAAASRRYPAVHLWMILGEPNRRANLAIDQMVSPTARTLNRTQARAPHIYAQMLDASYGALKAVSERNLVIGGNTYTTGDIPTGLWIKYLRLPNGKPPRMDLYGHNPFCWRAPNLSDPPSPDGEVDFSDLARLSALVNRELAAPGHQIRLFLSEWMIPTAPDSQLNIWVTPAVQAQWISDGWRIVRSSSFIYALGWVHLYDDPAFGVMSGLFTSQGAPKPGYYAFRNG
jgi:hypothetical protein